MSAQCPYCRERQADSDDHVFPEFLGGFATIRACATCNSGFGHRFEGPVAHALAPLIVFLSFSGYRHPRHVVHRKAWIDETNGVEYDVDTTFRSRPSRARVVENDGKITSIVAQTAGQAQRMIDGLRAKGRIGELVGGQETKTALRPPLRDLRINVGVEVRQLALKMCVALGQVVVPNRELLASTGRQLLLETKPITTSVRRTYERYSDLDDIRPPLAHVVYLEGDPERGRVFGVVQLFGGAIQLYVPLMSACEGAAFACVGVLDTVSWEESFRSLEPLKLPEAEEFITPAALAANIAGWGPFFNEQVRQALGRNDIHFRTTDKFPLGGINVRVPLLWIELSLSFSVRLEAAADREYAGPAALDLSSLVLSPDSGGTRSNVLEAFIDKWNAGALPRDLGMDHVYVPDELRPGTRTLVVEDVWYPVVRLEITYRVNRRAWAGYLTLRDCPGELNQQNGSLEARVQISAADLPATRDPSWAEILDIAEYEATTENLLILERSQIDPKSAYGLPNEPPSAPEKV